MVVLFYLEKTMCSFKDKNVGEALKEIGLGAADEFNKNVSIVPYMYGNKQKALDMYTKYKDIPDNEYTNFGRDLTGSSRNGLILGTGAMAMARLTPRAYEYMVNNPTQAFLGETLAENVLNEGFSKKKADVIGVDRNTSDIAHDVAGTVASKSLDVGEIKNKQSGKVGTGKRIIKEIPKSMIYQNRYFADEYLNNFAKKREQAILEEIANELGQ